MQSCGGESENEPEIDTSIDCSGFSISISHWTNDFNAKVDIVGRTYTSILWSTGDVGTTIGGEEGTLTEGTYSVTVKDYEGCELTESIKIEYKLVSFETTTLNCINDTEAIIEVKGINKGGTEITEQGICFSTAQNPTVNDSKVKNENISEYQYSLKLESLSSGTTYYARAYSVNSVGTSYGNEITFITNSSPSPFTIGQRHQGGIIVSLYCDGLSGLITPETDITNNNTQSWIVAHEKSEALVYNGYDDWKLPTVSQLRAMYRNLHINGLGDFHEGDRIYDAYWSSPQWRDGDGSCNYYAYYWDFKTNDGEVLSTCYKLHYRPVREF